MKTNTILLFLLFISIFCLAFSVDFKTETGTTFSGSLLPAKYKTDFEDAVKSLDYASLFIDRKKVADEGEIRIDQQGSFKKTIGTGKNAKKVTVYNMQAQINGKKGKTTVSHVEIYETVNTDKKADRTQILDAAKKAFLDSAADQKTRSIVPK